MLFNTVQFALFFAVVWSVHLALPPRQRNAWLLAASLLFYFLWIPVYLLLLLGEMAVNFALLRAMVRSRRPRRFLVAHLVFTFGILAWFKYAAFLVQSITPLTSLLGWRIPVPEVLLPLGISFFTFQMVGVHVDVYRGELEPPRSFARYVLFLSLFFHLVAGPILRGKELLPQLEAGARIEPMRTRRGLWLLASGVAKKVILADFLLAPFVSDVYANPGVAPAPVQLVATYSFAFQIYFDFSGYSDMARGLACLLGYELPLNFREPYLSRNPVEFWRCWHITLSQWLRDYLYIPLGGNRGGRPRTHANLLITMLLGGLWHGAGWTFVAWGGLHGLWLVVHRALGGRAAARPEASFTAGDALRVLACFHAVCALWVFFRAPDADAAVRILARIATGSYRAEWPALPTLLVALCAALHPIERMARTRLPRWLGALGRSRLGGAVEGAALGALAALALAASGVGSEFIYFQF
jgi:D-alanyl-lipoteichoic acid acyltransferase DltB (MBOAT superfamily)